jgi:hypothetical protein
MSIYIEQVKRKATYLSISIKRRTFVFNLNSLQKDKRLNKFVTEVLENPKILKVVLDSKSVLGPLTRSLSIANINF